MAYIDVEKRKAYYNQYAKERREWLKSHHCCTKCGQQDAYTLNGRAYCFDCNEKNNKRYKDDFVPNARHTYYEKRLAKHSENGTCMRCTTRKAVIGEKYCAICQSKIKNYCKKRYAEGKGKGKIPRHLRNSYGLCYNCGNELDGQLTKKGEKSKLCSHCYNNKQMPPKTAIIYTPFKATEASINYFHQKVKATEKLVADGVYDYMAIVNIESR